MIRRLFILGSDPLTLEIIINFNIIWRVIFYWFKIGLMTIFCKKFWSFCFSRDFICHLFFSFRILGAANFKFSFCFLQIHSPQAGAPPTRDFILFLVPGFSERIHPGIFWSRNSQMITTLLILGSDPLTLRIHPGIFWSRNNQMIMRLLILGSDPLTLEVIIIFNIIWHVIFYWFKIGFMTMFCKKFWSFCLSGDFILEEEGTQVFRVHTVSVFFAQYIQIIFLVQRSMKPVGYFQNFVTKIYN